MEALDLKAEARIAAKGQAKQLRQRGLVPGVVYGKGLETAPVQIDVRALAKVLSVAGTHQLINLQVGNQSPRLTLARDIQRGVLKRDYLHVDFYAVRMDEKVQAHVPLHLVGESPAVRELGGILTQGLDQIEMECLPIDLVAFIEVNIESLAALNDTITVADLTIPATLTILSDPDSMVVKIEAPRKLEEAEEAEALNASAEPEVITKARAVEAE